MAFLLPFEEERNSILELKILKLKYVYQDVSLFRHPNAWYSALKRTFLPDIFSVAQKLYGQIGADFTYFFFDNTRRQ